MESLTVQNGSSGLLLYMILDGTHKVVVTVGRKSKMHFTM